MWESEMMGYGGWMFFWALGGLFVFGAVIYVAVRLGAHYARRDEYGYYGGPPHSHDCGDDGHYYKDGRHRRDDDRYQGGEKR